MLKNKEKVRKIAIILTIILTILCLGINYRKITKEEYAPTLKSADAGELKIASATIDLNNGKLVPIYRPKWEKVSNTYDAVNKKISVVVKGSAYQKKTISSDVNIDYNSNVKSTLTSDKIKVYIDDEEATGLEIKLSDPTITTNATTNKNQITYTIEISGFEQNARITGRPYKE